MSKLENVNEALVEAFDALARARARQQVSEYNGNASNAAYYAETATKALGLIKDILELKDKTLVAAIVKTQEEPAS